jgi:phosphoribosylformimino-5-aminoimidazole carboxamide ribotide isomerase
MADIHRLLEPDCRILEGAISGRAIYDGRIDVAEALSLFRGVR